MSSILTGSTTPPDDPFDLRRFAAAQEQVYARALAEVRAGDKRSHWMWFILPQLDGLGSSHMARRYAISGLDEARAYLAHPLLGERYRETVAALPLASGTAVGVFGEIDAVKLRSSLTLFERAGAEVDAALAAWFGGERDPATLRLLG